MRDTQPDSNKKSNYVLTCKYVIARRRSPCEIELRVERAYNMHQILLECCQETDIKQMNNLSKQ